jgi:hypothetical protein
MSQDNGKVIKQDGSLFDLKFITKDEQLTGKCNLTRKLQKLVRDGVIKEHQLTDVIAEHDQDNCGLFHDLEFCTCDPEIYDIQERRLA